MNPKLPLYAAALALAPLLGGCVAVAALPMLAGGAMFAGGNVKIRAATPRPNQGRKFAVAKPERTAGAPVASDSGAGDSAALAELRAASQPDAGRAAADPWSQFTSWALARATSASKRSMLYETGSLLALPRMRECRAPTPAVVIDLDPATGTWSPPAASAAPGLAANLARLREAGVVVLWLTGQPAARVVELAQALRTSGLDPDGTDPLLLIRGRDDRKQVLREDANRDVCVIAIAGDRKADFDELFDYLRNPADALAFDSFLGAGWFIAPPPLQ